jgi:dTDP-4-amino-4,6-dideoxygalactose transaminase
MTAEPSLQKIPLVDLRAQYHAHRAELDAAVAACLETTSFIGGAEHAAFAKEFAAWCGGGHVTLCGNGTDALTLAIVELVGHGDGTREIVTVANTFIATAEAISNAGYRPVFVDVDSATHTMDPAAAERALTARTAALMPVHLYGHMAPMDRLMALARASGLKVIEDAAQAHGASWQGRKPGHWGDATCFSFFPGKNLGAWGDGGAVLTQDAALSERISKRANHGRIDKYRHDFIGMNSRLDGLQAAILRVKLRHLDAWTAARQRIARWYDERLAGLNRVVRPTVHAHAAHVFHLYVVEVDERDSVLATLNGQGIGAGVHYPVPLHEQPAYTHLGYRAEDLPVSSRLAKRVLSLPIYPEMTETQVDRVVRVLSAAVGA